MAVFSAAASAALGIRMHRRWLSRVCGKRRGLSDSVIILAAGLCSSYTSSAQQFQPVSDGHIGLRTQVHLAAHIGTDNHIRVFALQR